MMRPQSLGAVHTHTHTPYFLKNVWQTFATQIITNLITNTHKCAKFVENVIAKLALIDEQICKLEC